MNLSKEQIKKILDEAPDGATDWCTFLYRGGVSTYGFDGKCEAGVTLLREGWSHTPLSDLRKQLEGEWVNDDECLYLNAKTRHVFIGVDPRRNGYCYIQAPCYSVNFVEISKLSKPETEAERVERERNENGRSFYELMSSIEISVMNPDDSGHPNKWDELRDEWKEVYILQAEGLKYRKEVE